MAGKQRAPKPLTWAEQLAQMSANSRAIRGTTPNVDKENRVTPLAAVLGADTWAPGFEHPEPLSTARLVEILNDDGSGGTRPVASNEAAAIAAELLGLCGLLLTARTKVYGMLESCERERDGAERKWRATQGLSHRHDMERMTGAVHALEVLRPYVEKPKFAEVAARLGGKDGAPRRGPGELFRRPGGAE